MSNYATLKAAVQAVVKSNGVQSITGANLQSTLISMIESLGANYTFAGVATPSTTPGSPDQNVFYIGGAGTYTNFGSSYTVPVGNIGVFAYNGVWSKTYVASESIVNEINISKSFPTDGIDGTNVYSFATAVSKVPANMRSVGLRITFVNSEGFSETWEKFRIYGSFDSIQSWFKVNSMEVRESAESSVYGIDEGHTTVYGTEILTVVGYINSSGTLSTHSSYKASPMTALPTKPSSMAGILRFVKIVSSTVPNAAVMTIAFYDSNQTYIRGKSNQSLCSGYNYYGSQATYRIPENAAFFRACSVSGDTLFKVTFDVSVTGIPTDIYNDLLSTDERLSEESNMRSIIEHSYFGLETSYSTKFTSSILTVSNTYINANGSEVSNTSYISSPMTALPTKPTNVYGDIRLIRLTSRVNLNASLAPIAFYDNDQNFISTVITPTMVLAMNSSTQITALYIAPQGAVYFRVSDRQVSPYIFEMVVDVAVNGIIGKVIEHDIQLSQGDLPSLNKPSIWMPKHMYLLRGIKSQLFISGMVCAQNPETVHMDITYGSGMTSSNAKGYNRDRVFEWTPVADDTDQVYRFGYYNDILGNLYATNATTLHNVAPKTSPVTNKNILCIGDSFTDQNWWVSELNHLLTGHTDSLTDPNNTHGNDGLTNLTFIGTQDTDKTPNEGYSGKTYQWFCGSESPFYYNGDVSFTSYCNAHGFSGIDIAIILLGTNGGNGETYVRKIWDKLIEHNSNIRVLILGRCFAVPYGTGTAGMQHNQTWIKQSQGVHTLNAFFQGLTEDSDYNSRFLYVEYSAMLDNANNMPWSEVSANERHTDVMVRQATDNVHPSKYGFWQIADAVRGAFHYWCI